MSSYDYQYKDKEQLQTSWENYTSTRTPISAANLNKIQTALLNIDDAVFDAVNSKADQETMLPAITNVSFDPDTGIWTFTRLNGTTVQFDTALEKVVTNWAYDSENQRLVLTLEDGTTQYVDLSALIQNNEFVDSDTIAFTVGNNGTVTADLIDGSITGSKLQPDYLANCTAQASAAASRASTAQDYAQLAESYTHGGTNRQDRPTESTDNAMFYKNLAQQAVIDAQAAAGLTDFTPATSSAAGVHGLVPAPPIKTEIPKILGEDGWTETPPSGVTSFNDREGDVVPASGDYTASQISYAGGYVSDYLMQYKDVSISASADTSLSGYTYAQTVAWTGAAATDDVDLAVISGGYDGNLAAEAMANAVKIYYQDNPSGGTVRVYRIAAIAAHGGVDRTTYYSAENLIAMAVNDGDYANEVITINSGRATYDSSTETITFE